MWSRGKRRKKMLWLALSGHSTIFNHFVPIDLKQQLIWNIPWRSENLDSLYYYKYLLPSISLKANKEKHGWGRRNNKTACTLWRGGPTPGAWMKGTQAPCTQPETPLQWEGLVFSSDDNTNDCGWGRQTTFLEKNSSLWLEILTSVEVCTRRPRKSTSTSGSDCLIISEVLSDRHETPPLPSARRWFLEQIVFLTWLSI